MPELFTLLLKINIVLILFATAYYMVLKKLTFYSINRLFLIFGILFSSIYPFIDLTDFFHRQQQSSYVAFVPDLNQKVNGLVPSDFVALHWQAISFLFYIVVAIMALRLMMQFFSLYLMHKKSTPGAVNHYPVRMLNEPVSPFSFWQTIYINPKLHQEGELETILAHEQIHVKEWHSLDIILAELSVVFYWFNPGVWLMKKAVKENLEFITDQKILKKGVDRKTYQYSLLDVSNLTPAVTIVNNFNLSDLKKRIKMMNVKRSSRLTLGRYLLITPILLITTLAFTVAKKDIKRHFAPIQKALANHHLFRDTIAPPQVATKSPKKKSLPIVANKTQMDTTGKLNKIYNAIFITLDSSKREFSSAVSQVSALMQTSEKPGDVSAQTVMVLRGVKIDSAQYEKQLVKVLAHKSENDQVTIQNFKVTGISIKKQGDLVSNQPRKVNIAFRHKLVRDTVGNDNLVYIVDGKKITRDELQKIDVESIKSVDVVKRNTGDPIVVIGRKTP